jgi:hypothetical protein
MIVVLRLALPEPIPAFIEYGDMCDPVHFREIAYWKAIAPSVRF